MRHRVVGKKLNRSVGHRVAMRRTMADQLFEHGKIETTITKAKWLRPFAERLITKAKKADSSKDKISRFNLVKDLRTELRQETTLRKLVVEIAPKFATKEGGYTRIIKLANRGGDQAQRARIELIVDEEKKQTKKTTVKKEKAKVEKKVEETKEESVKETVEENENAE